MAALLRPGNAGSNTAADHIETAQLALAQLPKHLRRGRQTLIRTDSAGGTRAFLDWLSRPGRWLSYSVGMTITDAIHQAVLKIPKKAWTPAYDAGGTERPGAWVAEITDMPDLSTWPKGMRLVVRKERPHPGAQLRFTDLDGLRLTCFATNTKGGQLADLELRHRRRARCEDCIRVARDTGLRNLPLHDTAQNQIWLEIVSPALDLLAWMPMLALTGKTRRWEPKKLRLRLFSAAAQPREHRPPSLAPLHRPMALDGCDHPRDPATRSPAEPRLTSNSDRPDEPQQYPGAVEPRRPPDATAWPPTCSSPRNSAPHKHKVPVSEPTRTHERSRLVLNSSTVFIRFFKACGPMRVPGLKTNTSGG